MILGLTGFSGAGKSTVATIFKEHGFYHLDCDRLVHEEVYRDPEVLSAIAAAFGADLLCEGTLNRPALRARTMGKPEALKKLNDTVMPFILQHIERKLEKHKAEPIILDAPLLFESGLDRKCDKVLSVITDREEALHRIMERDGLSRTDAEKRLSSQPPAEFYIKKSDYVLENNQGLHTLSKQALELLQELYDPAL
ncbi:MAG: dephospho-CoA kinase [Clostridia bacterium]|nr:dephospho-CoA kinase [Clostridia bacterium]